MLSVAPVVFLQVFTRDELQMIADLCIKHDTLCFSDEVYEWLIYRGHEHIKIGTFFSSTKLFDKNTVYI